MSPLAISGARIFFSSDSTWSHCYRERFEKSAYLKGHYPEALSARVERLIARYGFAPRDAEELPADWPVDPQMALFG